MGPGVWRMMTLQLDFNAKFLRLYLDSRLVGDSMKELQINSLFNSPIPQWAQVHDFSRSFIQFDSNEGATGPDFSQRVDSINFRAADICLFQHVLPERKLSKIHLDPTWPRGGIMQVIFCRHVSWTSVDLKTILSAYLLVNDR